MPATSRSGSDTTAAAADEPAGARWAHTGSPGGRHERVDGRCGASVASPTTHFGDIGRQGRNCPQAPVLTSPPYPPRRTAGINRALARHGGSRMHVGTLLSTVHSCQRRIVPDAALSKWSGWLHRKVHEVHTARIRGDRRRREELPPHWYSSIDTRPSLMNHARTRPPHQQLEQLWCRAGAANKKHPGQQQKRAVTEARCEPTQTQSILDAQRHPRAPLPRPPHPLVSGKRDARAATWYCGCANEQSHGQGVVLCVEVEPRGRRRGRDVWDSLVGSAIPVVCRRASASSRRRIDDMVDGSTTDSRTGQERGNPTTR